MATCNDVVDAALRKLAVLRAGRVANAVQAHSALIALRGLYGERVAQGLYGRMKTRRVATSPYDAKIGERVIWTGSGSLTLNKPDLISTWDDEEIPTPDLAVIIEAGATPKVWVYDVDIAAWVNTQTLALGDEAPLSTRLFNGLAAMLAVRIAPEWSVDPPPQAVLDATAAVNTLAMRWSEDRDVVRPEWY